MVNIITKYFTKEQVMNAMGEQNLMLDDIWGVEQRLDELPPADVVEVVRCENCKHMRTISGEGWGIDTELYYCGENEILVSPVGYCSDGKRRNRGGAKAMTNAEKFLAEILPEIIPYELKCNLHSLRCPGEDCNGECFDCFNRNIIWLQEEVEGESDE